MNPVSSPGLAQRLTALLLLALVIGLGYWLIDRVLIGQYRHYQAHAERLQDRLQNLQRLATARPELEKAIQTIRDDQRTAAYFLPPAPPTLAAADLQQRVKTLVEGAGGSLLSVQLRVAGEVRLQKLRRDAAELAVEALNRQVQPIAGFCADSGEGTGDIKRYAHFNGISRVNVQCAAQGQSQRGGFQLQHGDSLELKTERTTEWRGSCECGTRCNAHSIQTEESH